MQLSDLASAIVILYACVRASCSLKTEATLPCKLGDCTGYLSCRILRSALSLGTLKSSKDVISIVKQHGCGGSESRSVCCTDLAADLVRNNILANYTDEDSAVGLAQLMTTPCGISKGSDRPLYGVNAFLFEFPWMTLLEYNTTQGKSFFCAGSLISNRYVLTAAHCFMASDSQLVNVRLGEYDISKEVDCEEYGGDVMDCAPPVQNHQVDDVVIHADFMRGFQHDIALVRLKYKVDFGDRISPICLPIWEDSANDISRASIAGWGYTANGNISDVLQKADLPVLPIEFCNKLFARDLSSSHICAGGQNGIDTCKGDSGGPLFARDSSISYRFMQFGVLSGGGVLCGANSTVPSIYTNLVEYMPWIVKHIRA